MAFVVGVDLFTRIRGVVEHARGCSSLCVESFERWSRPRFLPLRGPSRIVSRTWVAHIDPEILRDGR